MGNEISTCCASASAVKHSDGPQEKGAVETTGNSQPKKDSPIKAEQVSTNAPQGQTGPKHGTHQALRLLGRGTAADTWLFRDIKLSKPVAIKMFQRPIDYYPVSAVQREVMTQTELGPGHINLINVYELFLTPEHLGLVMECAEGGSLTTYVGACWEKAQPHSLVLPEDEVLYLFKQFISAVAYCHSHTIAHRDLKLDNTLLDGSDPPILKICDFGFARHFDSPLERTTSHLGTPEYMSPELLHVTEGGQHDQYDPRSVDVWASGVLLLVCLCGAFPFDHTAHNVSQPHQDNETDLWSIPAGKPSLKERVARPVDVFTLYNSVGSFQPTLGKLVLQEVSKNWSKSSFIAHNVQALSPEVRDLLDQIFKVDPKKRITVRGIMQHPWYNKQLPAKYQDALDRIEEQQAVLEKHVQQIQLDPEKASQRQRAIQEMIEESGTRADSKQRKSSMRPLHMLDMNHEDLSSIDLTEQAVLAEESTHGGNSALEKERFANDGVRQAVDKAFSKSGSQSEISSAVNEVKQQGAPVGGGAV